jgi:hypothetical protein
MSADRVAGARIASVEGVRRQVCGLYGKARASVCGSG